MNITTKKNDNEKNKRIKESKKSICKLWRYTKLFECNINCPIRIRPIARLKYQGQHCSYQKNRNIKRYE